MDTDITEGPLTRYDTETLFAAYKCLSEDEKTLLGVAVGVVEEYLGDEVGITAQIVVGRELSDQLQQMGLRLQLVRIDT